MRKHKTSSSRPLHLGPTRVKILKAAKKVFIEWGFAGASISKIAKNANINHSLIFHHFGNKEGLWRAVKQHIMNESNKHKITPPELHLPFRDFLKQSVIQNISFYRNNPDLIRMLNWQRLEHKNKKEMIVSLGMGPKAWLLALKHYQDKGDIGFHLKLDFVYTFIISIINNVTIDTNLLYKKESDLNDYINFALDGLLNALKTSL